MVKLYLKNLLNIIQSVYNKKVPATYVGVDNVPSANLDIS